jgi:hypothetical protein
MAIVFDSTGKELSSEFLDLLYLNRDRTIYTKINLLSWDEKKIKEIQGRVISGSMNSESSSPIRRTLSLQFFLDRDVYSLSAAADEIAINKKIQAFIGIENNVYGREEAVNDNIIWFNLGIFLITEASFSHSIDSNTISIQAQDKMVMLNGILGGQIGADVSFTIGSNGEKLPYFYIIKDSLIKFGAENESKVIINEVPIMIPNIQRMIETKTFNYNTNTKRTFNETGQPLAIGPTITLDKNEEVDVYITFSPISDYDFKATNNITDILEKVKQDLFGTYTYYYDENGFFRFEPVRELYQKDSFQLQYLQEISNGNYFPRYDKIQYGYDFSDKGIVSSFSNSPQWRGIKNDFYVYGEKNILFHLAIDSKPIVPSQFYEKNSDGTWGNVLVNYSQPWQQFLIDQAEYLLYTNPGSSISYYYEELKAFFEFTEDKADKTLGIYKRLGSTDGAWRRSNTGIESEDFFSISNYIGNNTTTVTATSPFHGLLAGQSFSIVNAAGTEESKLNGSWTVSEVTDVNTFKFIISTSLASGTYTTDIGRIEVPQKKGISSKWKYFFDILDEGAPAYSGFSISAIGRRIKAINDQSIESLYPSVVPENSNRLKIIIFNDTPFLQNKIWAEEVFLEEGDIIKNEDNQKYYEVSGVGINGRSIPVGSDPPTNVSGLSSIDGIIYKYIDFLKYNEDAVNTELELKQNGDNYYSILKSQISNFLDNEIYPYVNDAFTNIKSTIYTHTNFSETVQISSIPIYNLEVNRIINILDLDTKIIGDYYVQSLSFNFSQDSQMSITAQKIY